VVKSEEDRYIFLEHLEHFLYANLACVAVNKVDDVPLQLLLLLHQNLVCENLNPHQGNFDEDLGHIEVGERPDRIDSSI
jgi:hypothetical protein